MLPIIGITVDDYPEYSGIRLREDYFYRVGAAGGLPLLLPPVPAQPGLLEQLLAALDGLLVSGGGDYDLADPSPRDSLELGLIKLAFDRCLPLLGICRGMQGLVLALGGELWQDLGAGQSGFLQHQQIADRHQTSHSLNLLPPLSSLYGADQLMVNSHHHQGVRRLPPQLRATAYAPDGLVEAVCAGEGRRFAWGLQWHPEALAGHEPPFQALVAAAQYGLG